MTDALRPSLHFSATRGWINDPLALTWHDGAYHLFYQYVPGQTTWSLDCRWGHAMSDDLLTWRELPTALEPAPDEGGAWSGCLVQDDAGQAQIFYTSVLPPQLDAGRIRSARPTASDWLRWQPGEIVLEQPSEIASRIFRDPFVVRDGDRWRMLVGAALDTQAALFGFSSADLKRWSYDGVVLSREDNPTDTVWTGAGWECPQLLRVDGEDVLVVSIWEPDAIHYVAAALGTYKDGRFRARSWQRLTYGSQYYAGSSFVDKDGEPGLIYWIRDREAKPSSLSAGSLSVPHRLTIREGRVVAEPHPAVVDPAALREAAVALDRLHAPGVVTWPGGEAVVLERDHEDIVVSIAGEERGRMPGSADPVYVLIDESIVELWGSRGVLALHR